MLNMLRWNCVFRRVLILLVLLSAVLPAVAWDRGSLADYQERRARLLRETSGNGVIVLFGYEEQDVAASVTGFHQNENFYY
ncbi:MAG: hypothetical protein LAP13_13805, partial [Acidobacteriia bacterium]|nr:hypothetical protein [Terriglobia bacterium]